MNKRECMAAVRAQLRRYGVSNKRKDGAEWAQVVARTHGIGIGVYCDSPQTCDVATRAIRAMGLKPAPVLFGNSVIISGGWEELAND